MPLHLKLDGNSTSPLYQQIVDKIRRDVAAGKLTPGYQLPTVRELADEMKISRGTIKHAYDQLEHLGIVETTQGKGTFINAPDAQALTRKFRQKKLEEFAEYSQRLLDEGFSKGELYNEINNLKEGE